MTTTVPVTTINPYLVDGPPVVVTKASKPAQAWVPEMSFGSMPNDGGNLILSNEEAVEIRLNDPVAAKYLRKLIGARDMLHGQTRWCLWALDVQPHEVRLSPTLRSKADAVRNYREKSDRPATNALAEYPLRFGEIRQPSARYLCLPRHPSQNRRHVPIAFFDPVDIAHDSTLVVPNANLFLFGILSSDMFTTWLMTVGGRIKSDFRISVGVVYNTFPFVSPSDKQRAAIEEAASAVLSARVAHRGSTLSDLYDRATAPMDVVKAHVTLDRTVRRLYQPRAALATELARQEELFSRYAASPHHVLPEGRQ
ncbi:MAG: type IIL restriction-modification enzyme MmeI [Candidatus Angelobacter sp.]